MQKTDQSLLSASMTRWGGTPTSPLVGEEGSGCFSFLFQEKKQHCPQLLNNTFPQRFWGMRLSGQGKQRIMLQQEKLTKWLTPLCPWQISAKARRGVHHRTMACTCCLTQRKQAGRLWLNHWEKHRLTSTHRRVTWDLPVSGPQGPQASLTCLLFQLNSRGGSQSPPLVSAHLNKFQKPHSAAQFTATKFWLEKEWEARIHARIQKHSHIQCIYKHPYAHMYTCMRTYTHVHT